LIAGDSAFKAMSTSMRNANIGSCSSVRSGPIAIVSRRTASAIVAAVPYNAKSGSSVAMKSPTCGTTSITPPCRRASMTSVGRSTASTMPALALCSSVRAGAPSPARSGPCFGQHFGRRAGYTDRMTDMPSSPTLATTLTGRRSRAA
jgi:hypothetical protein